MDVILQGELFAGSFHYAIVASRFNDVITRRLIDGAVDCLSRHGAANEQIDIVMVPGSFEIPLATKFILKQEKYDAVICLGAVIRGDTPHNEYIASEVTKGIAQLSLEFSVPVVFGVLTTDTIEQALERAGLKQGNKGWEAALTAIEMTNLLKKFQ